MKLFCGSEFFALSAVCGKSTAIVPQNSDLFQGGTKIAGSFLLLSPTYAKSRTYFTTFLFRGNKCAWIRGLNLFNWHKSVIYQLSGPWELKMDCAYLILGQIFKKRVFMAFLIISFARNAYSKARPIKPKSGSWLLMQLILDHLKFSFSAKNWIFRLRVGVLNGLAIWETAMLVFGRFPWQLWPLSTKVMASYLWAKWPTFKQNLSRGIAHKNGMFEWQNNKKISS